MAVVMITVAATLVDVWQQWQWMWWQQRSDVCKQLVVYMVAAT